MRAKTDPSFCEYLMRIGNGQEKTNMNDKIIIPRCFIVPYTTEKESLDLLFKTIYPDFHTSFQDSTCLTSRVILTTKNDFVHELNDRLIAQLPKNAKTFVAIDEIVERSDQSEFEDFLHSLNPPGLPPYKLTLKENCPIMLLRNLNPCEGDDFIYGMDVCRCCYLSSSSQVDLPSSLTTSSATTIRPAIILPGLGSNTNDYEKLALILPIVMLGSYQAVLLSIKKIFWPGGNGTLSFTGHSPGEWLARVYMQ
ncbi:hypothetical protein FXO37_08819 [Capsicum annuum]|nr:hypothetical protein FXO37_08819 [Capsicum annuum]